MPALCVLVSDASATPLQSIDLLSAGDGLVTRDTDQGIDWLDLTETVGMSVSEALTTFPSWRLATGGELCGFVAQAEPVPGLQFCGYTTVNVTGSRPWSAMLSFWGLTFTNGSTLPNTGNNALGASGISDANGSTLQRQTWALPPQPQQSGTFSGLQFGAEPSPHPDVGIFLVAAIPEPGTGALVAMGLLGFGATVRRWKS